MGLNVFTLLQITRHFSQLRPRIMGGHFLKKCHPVKMYYHGLAGHVRAVIFVPGAASLFTPNDVSNAAVSATAAHLKHVLISSVKTWRHVNFTHVTVGLLLMIAFKDRACVTIVKRLSCWNNRGCVLKVSVLFLRFLWDASLTRETSHSDVGGQPDTPEFNTIFKAIMTHLTLEMTNVKRTRNMMSLQILY